MTPVIWLTLGAWVWFATLVIAFSAGCASMEHPDALPPVPDFVPVEWLEDVGK